MQGYVIFLGILLTIKIKSELLYLLFAYILTLLYFSQLATLVNIKVLTTLLKLLRPITYYVINIKRICIRLKVTC